MKQWCAVSLSVMLAAITAVPQAQPQEKKADAKGGALERFKKLEGEWVGKGTHGDMTMDARAVYKVTSGGSAVVETLDPGGPHEMVTVIHADGDALALTHYCALGNQPHMKAMPKPGDDKVEFKFVKATNLKSDKDMYMGSVTFTFSGNDKLKAEWTLFNDGKPAEKAVFEMSRKK